MHYEKYVSKRKVQALDEQTLTCKSDTPAVVITTALRILPQIQPLFTFNKQGFKMAEMIAERDAVGE